MAQPSYKYLIFVCYFVHLFSICNLLYDIKHIFSDVLLLSLNIKYYVMFQKVRHLRLAVTLTYDNFWHSIDAKVSSQMMLYFHLSDLIYLC